MQIGQIALGAPKKLADKWDGPCIVQSVRNVQVELIDPKGKLRRVHINRISAPVPQTDKRPASSKRGRGRAGAQNSGSKRRAEDTERSSSTSSSSDDGGDEDDQYEVRINPRVEEEVGFAPPVELPDSDDDVEVDRAEESARETQTESEETGDDGEGDEDAASIKSEVKSEKSAKARPVRLDRLQTRAKDEISHDDADESEEYADESEENADEGEDEDEDEDQSDGDRLQTESEDEDRHEDQTERDSSSHSGDDHVPSADAATEPPAQEVEESETAEEAERDEEGERPSSLPGTSTPQHAPRATDEQLTAAPARRTRGRPMGSTKQPSLTGPTRMSTRTHKMPERYSPSSYAGLAFDLFSCALLARRMSEAPTTSKRAAKRAREAARAETTQSAELPFQVCLEYAQTGSLVPAALLVFLLDLLSPQLQAVARNGRVTPAGHVLYGFPTAETAAAAQTCWRLQFGPDGELLQPNWGTNLKDSAWQQICESQRLDTATPKPKEPRVNLAHLERQRALVARLALYRADVHAVVPAAAFGQASTSAAASSQAVGGLRQPDEEDEDDEERRRLVIVQDEEVERTMDEWYPVQPFYESEPAEQAEIAQAAEEEAPASAERARALAAAPVVVSEATRAAVARATAALTQATQDLQRLRGQIEEERSYDAEVEEMPLEVPISAPTAPPKPWFWPSQPTTIESLVLPLVRTGQDDEAKSCFALHVELFEWYRQAEEVLFAFLERKTLPLREEKIRNWEMFRRVLQAAIQPAKFDSQRLHQLDNAVALTHIFVMHERTNEWSKPIVIDEDHWPVPTTPWEQVEPLETDPHEMIRLPMYGAGFYVARCARARWEYKIYDHPSREVLEKRLGKLGAAQWKPKPWKEWHVTRRTLAYCLEHLQKFRQDVGYRYCVQHARSEAFRMHWRQHVSVLESHLPLIATFHQASAIDGLQAVDCHSRALLDRLVNREPPPPRGPWVPGIRAEVAETVEGRERRLGDERFRREQSAIAQTKSRHG